MALGAPFSSTAVSTKVRLLPCEAAALQPALTRAIAAFDHSPSGMNSVMRNPAHWGYLSPARYRFWRTAEDGLETRPPLAMRRLLAGIESGEMPEWYVAYAAFAELKTASAAFSSFGGSYEIRNPPLYALERYDCALNRGAIALINTGLAIDQATRGNVAGLPFDFTLTDHHLSEFNNHMSGRLLVPAAQYHQLTLGNTPHPSRQGL